MDPHSDLERLAETKHLRLVRRGRWDFVQRTKASGVVVIIAIIDDGRMLFVEQYRPPVDNRVIEFPAGLAGDHDDPEGESLAEAARRELLEETGYSAGSLERVFSGPSSAGLTDEIVTFFVARDLEQTAPGGGAGEEQIQVHEVLLRDVEQWLQQQRSDGLLVDARVLAGLYLLAKA